MTSKVPSEIAENYPAVVIMVVMMISKPTQWGNLYQTTHLPPDENTKRLHIQTSNQILHVKSVCEIKKEIIATMTKRTIIGNDNSDEEDVY